VHRRHDHDEGHNEKDEGKQGQQDSEHPTERARTLTEAFHDPSVFQRTTVPRFFQIAARVSRRAPSAGSRFRTIRQTVLIRRGSIGLTISS